MRSATRPDVLSLWCMRQVASRWLDERHAPFERVTPRNGAREASILDGHGALQRLVPNRVGQSRSYNTALMTCGQFVCVCVMCMCMYACLGFQGRLKVEVMCKLKLKEGSDTCAGLCTHPAWLV